MKFTISCFLTLQMLHTIFGKDWPSSSREEDINGRRASQDDGRQPIGIGHLSDSGLGDKRKCVKIPNINKFF